MPNAGQPAKMMATPVAAAPARATRALERSSTPAFERSTALSSQLSSFEGCYAVENPPAVSLRPLPDRFQLEHTVSAAGEPQNVVRTIDPTGRPAEPLPGSEWRQVSETAANVSWLTDGRLRALTLRVGENGIQGRADSAVVRKTKCTGGER